MILEKELWPFNSFRNQSNIEQLIFPAGTKKTSNFAILDQQTSQIWFTYDDAENQESKKLRIWILLTLTIQETTMLNFAWGLEL